VALHLQLARPAVELDVLLHSMADTLSWYSFCSRKRSYILARQSSPWGHLLQYAPAQFCQCRYIAHGLQGSGKGDPDLEEDEVWQVGEEVLGAEQVGRPPVALAQQLLVLLNQLHSSLTRKHVL
jgi:hypothetical protein